MLVKIRNSMINIKHINSIEDDLYDIPEEEKHSDKNVPVC